MRGRVVAMVVGIVLGLSAPAHAADAPDQLAAQAAGVVGSGDQLSLILKAPDGERVLKLGEVYDQGWVLQALTPSVATLARDGVTREVGLNPTGELASTAPKAAPSKVELAGLPDEATIKAYVAANPSKILEGTQQGLTLDEARRMAVYEGMMSDEYKRQKGDASGSLTFTPADQRALLGDVAYADMLASRADERNHHLRQIGAPETVTPADTEENRTLLHLVLY